MKEVNGWKRYVVNPDSNFFPVFSKVIKEVEHGKDILTISVINKARSAATKTQIKDLFRFEFDWQGDDICGIEVFKKEG